MGRTIEAKTNHSFKNFSAIEFQKNKDEEMISF